MGCCQSVDQQVDSQEREQVHHGVSLPSECGVSEFEFIKRSGNYQKLIGYDTILKDRERMVSYNSNRLISGNICLNIINAPKIDFFSQYQIGKFLGQGGFGTVCVATHRLTNAKRAIKMVSKEALSQRELSILLEELAILKEIDHPNILKVLENYQDDQHHFFVTELLSGGELFSKIMDLKGFDENQASNYMRQILSAVSYCHSLNIVHRDLKPENILFQSKNTNSQIKVIDFGCSTKFDRRKKIKDIAGTVLYLAPEIIKKDLYDEKCDIWSLGVVMYIMLCGYPPFDGVTDEELFQNIQFKTLKFEGNQWNHISNEAKDLISQMLVKDPQKRISGLQAYQHPWIQKRIKHFDLQESIMKNLAQFSARNKVKTAIMNMISLHILSNKDKQEIIQNFQRLDVNGDGQLSKEELTDGYENIIGDREQAVQIVEAVFHEIDYDGSGLVSFQEFLVASVNKEKMFSRENLIKAFDLIDEDRNGYVTKDELERLVGGSPINELVWENMMKECDINGDGKLDKGEFINLLMKWLERDLFTIDEVRQKSHSDQLTINFSSPRNFGLLRQHKNQFSQSTSLVSFDQRFSRKKKFSGNFESFLILSSKFSPKANLTQSAKLFYGYQQKGKFPTSEFQKGKESCNISISSYIPNNNFKYNFNQNDVEFKSCQSIGADGLATMGELSMKHNSRGLTTPFEKKQIAK